MSSIAADIASGLAGWIRFEFLCGRGYSFSESYLTAPIIQLLEATWRKNGGGAFPHLNAVSEWKHPYLERPKGGGDKVRLDAAVIGRTNLQHLPSGSLVAAVEMKWCGFSNPSASVVLWDLYRLASISLKQPDVTCIFILAGLKNRVDAFLGETAKFRESRGKSYGLLRSEKTGRFPDLRFRQLTANSKSKLTENFKRYRNTDELATAKLGQISTVRMDAGTGGLCASVLAIQVIGRQ